jgi:hypothetical protein
MSSDPVCPLAAPTAAYNGCASSCRGTGQQHQSPRGGRPRGRRKRVEPTSAVNWLGVRHGRSARFFYHSSGQFERVSGVRSGSGSWMIG